MPFNLSQILGGWKKKKTSKVKEFSGSSPQRKSAKSGDTRAQMPKETVLAQANLQESKSGKSGIAGFGQNLKSDLAWNVINFAHVSEKATMMGENKYVFKVNSSANKFSIKRAVEERYGVNIINVAVLNLPPKSRRRGATLGKKPGFKKAVVTLKTGQTISQF